MTKSKANASASRSKSEQQDAVSVASGQPASAVWAASSTTVKPPKGQAKAATSAHGWPSSKAKKQPALPPVQGKRLIPRQGSVTVRFYRTGHGDCFLIALPTVDADRAVYVLIDCGYKPGSPQMIAPATSIKEITDNLREATGGRIDVAIITHEHQDHVNGISEKHFSDIEIGQSWFAWTEDPDDALANQLREKHHDTLVGLLEARKLMGMGAIGSRLDDLLSFEIGGEDEVFQAAAADPAKSLNKRAMKLFKDKATDGVRYIRPHEPALSIPEVEGLRIFALGPPRDLEMLADTDPHGQESFPKSGMALESSFAAAIEANAQGVVANANSPFALRYGHGWDQARQSDPFFQAYFGYAGLQGQSEDENKWLLQESSDPWWRGIDHDWLNSAEQYALAMGEDTNNASLVLAFELSPGGKVLLFAADAQRGNWRSWTRAEFQDDKRTISTKDLLSRTVLYKVGHHGSHNATLAGGIDDDYANLSWMAQGEHGHEFTAMITAVRAWAQTQKGWDHPQKAIKDALLKKASGRVFQTDTALTAMQATQGSRLEDWQAFVERSREERLYFDYTVNIDA